MRAFVLTLVLLATLPAEFCKLQAQQRRQIVIEKANVMRNLRRDGKEIRRLIGDVVIRHDDVTMKCDSAYEYLGTNRFDAFGNIRVIQETTTLYGDTLNFDGNTRKGQVRGEIVRLVDEEATLITHFLDFDTNINTANYYSGGIITTPDAHFSSQRGIYYNNKKLFVFAGEVAYSDIDILLNTDSLEYNSDTELIRFYGPTRIYNEENYVFCNQGWYNREKEQSEFKTEAFIDTGSERIFGNKIFYDKLSGFSEIIGNGCIIDTTRNITIYGEEITYYESTEEAVVKENPLAVSVSEQGDTLFLRANKLIGISIKDSIHTDSTLYRLLKGVGNVRFYSHDIQGVCDSMVFHNVDSILFMYIEPILWNDENQLTANNINMLFKNENIHRIFLIGSAFVSSQEDSIRFNQIKGREMEGFFAQGNLNRLDVNGNGQTVYYLRDKDELSAVNRAESSRLSIMVKENKVTSIMFREKPTATLFPVDKVDIQDVSLSGFVWHKGRRPNSKMDIIPPALNLHFHVPIENRANQYRDLKMFPTESL